MNLEHIIYPEASFLFKIKNELQMYNILYKITKYLLKKIIFETINHSGLYLNGFSFNLNFYENTFISY